MSTTLISHSDDLRRLRNEGYEVNVQANVLVLRNIPYVTQEREVERGTLVSQLAVSGDITTKPDRPCGVLRRRLAARFGGKSGMEERLCVTLARLWRRANR